MECAREITRTHVVRLSPPFTRSGRVNGAMLRLHRTRSMSSHQVASKLVLYYFFFSSNVASLTRPQFSSTCQCYESRSLIGQCVKVILLSFRPSPSVKLDPDFPLSEEQSVEYVGISP